jgi:hypothetical protein
MQGARLAALFDVTQHLGDARARIVFACGRRLRRLFQVFNRHEIKRSVYLLISFRR